MRKYPIIATLAIVIFIFSNCHSGRKLAAPPKMTYETNIKTLIEANCTPCHIPSKNGNKKPLDSYAAVQEKIDDMIRRIELNPADKGFMPFKHAKLSDSTIAIFRQWKTDGMLEK